MKHFIQSIIFKIINALEIIISCLIVVAIVILTRKMALSLVGLWDEPTVDGALSVFLAQCFNLVIGIELVKMLVKHSIATVIEVLVFAIARQMIVEHLTPEGTLISILGLALLFVIRKYLFKKLDATEKTVYRANQPVKLVNMLEHIHIPAEEKETLGMLVIRELEDSGQEIGMGAVVYYKEVALRIAKITNDVVTRVEVIKQVA